VPDDAPQDELEDLTDALVHHLADCFEQYAESTVTLPQEDAEFARWLSTVPGFPGPLAVGVCTRAALAGPLEHAVEEVRAAHGVLVVCDGTDSDEDLPTVHRVDVVQVRHRSEIAGAVVEALAGDTPLVVDVRLPPSEAAELFGSRRTVA